jgi:hypothetical protein
MEQATMTIRPHLSVRARALLRRCVYPLLCALSLLWLPYQPDKDPPLHDAVQIAQGIVGDGAGH